MSRFNSDIVSTKSDCASRFLKGLTLKIQNGIKKYFDFRDLYDRALEYERILYKKGSANKRKFGGGNNSGSKRPTTWDRRSFQLLALAKNTVWKCRLCGKDNRGLSYTGKIICYKCKKEGHVSTNCRASRELEVLVLMELLVLQEMFRLLLHGGLQVCTLLASM